MPIFRRRVEATILDSTSEITFTIGADEALTGWELPAAFTATTVYLIVEAGAAYDGSEASVIAQPKDYSGTALADSKITVAATNSNRQVDIDLTKWQKYDTFTIGTYATDGSTAVVQDADRTIVALVSSAIA